MPLDLANIELTAYGIELVPIITAIVELLKRRARRYLGKELAGDISIVASLTLGQLFAHTYVADGWQEGLLAGLIMGMSASGLFSFGKQVLRRGEPER